jgi:hypothetical protein
MTRLTMGICCHFPAARTGGGGRPLGSLALIALGLVVFLTGCGSSSDGRLAFSGRVSLRGTPLESGTIEFVSSDGKYQSGGTIAKGTYSVPKEKGLPPGKYVVRISAVKESGPAPTGPPGPEAEQHKVEQLVPPEYNVKTTLSAEITKGGRNEFPFDLK